MHPGVTPERVTGFAPVAVIVVLPATASFLVRLLRAKDMPDFFHQEISNLKKNNCCTIVASLR
jgi:hypothetical protein